MYFTLLSTKTKKKKKSMQTAQYGEKKHSQKRVFSVFMSVLGTKTMEITIYGNTKQHNEKLVL